MSRALRVTARVCSASWNRNLAEMCLEKYRRTYSLAFSSSDVVSMGGEGRRETWRLNATFQDRFGFCELDGA